MTKQEKTQEIVAVLKTIFDPELPVNIWDLGLIYGIEILDENTIKIVMTLTSPNCPAIDILPQQIEDSLLNLDFVDEVDLRLVWEPTWNKDLIDEEIRFDLGI
jgi:metal-sulfur cluster biosynthetic enzyme